MGYYQEPHQQPRSREIERIFQENKPDIEADLRSIKLSMRDIANKYKVNDRNVRRWGERLGIDCNQRTIDRRAAGLDVKKCITKKAKQKDEVANPKLLSMPW